jgi:hypothetical protein
MMYFEADPRSNVSVGGFGSCNTCCPESATGIPGEVNRWRIGYGDWLCGIHSGRGLFRADFSFLKITPNPVAPFPSVLPPTNVDYQFQIEANTSFSGTVSTSAVSPQSTPMTFALDPVNPPKTGIVAMNSDGTFIYIPQAGFIGVDTFTYVTSDGINTPVKNTVTFGVDVVVATPFSTPLPAGVINPSAPESSAQVYETPLPPNEGLIYVDPRIVKMRGFHLDFGVTVSPECLVGQVYRMTVASQAMDCDKAIYRHISSYDILISSCGLP